MGGGEHDHRSMVALLAPVRLGSQDTDRRVRVRQIAMLGTHTRHAGHRRGVVERAAPHEPAQLVEVSSRERDEPLQIARHAHVHRARDGAACGPGLGGSRLEVAQEGVVHVQRGHQPADRQSRLRGEQARGEVAQVARGDRERTAVRPPPLTDRVDVIEGLRYQAAHVDGVRRSQPQASRSGRAETRPSQAPGNRRTSPAPGPRSRPLPAW